MSDVIITKGSGAPNTGTAIDHIAWAPRDVHASIADWKKKGVTPSDVRIQIVDHSAHFDKRDTN